MVIIQKTKVFRVKVDYDKGIAFEDLCRNEKKNINSKLKELIDSSLMGNKRYFFAGKNKIKYNKTNNNFSWVVQLDSGEEIEVLNNLSLDFLKNLKSEIDYSIQEKNDWVHQKNPDSVEIHEKLIGDKNGH